jgi:glycine cleavage system H protein
MSELRYTKDHEWVRLDGDIAVVGISDYAQKQLGDVVYVELPAVGKSFAQGAEACTVESVKAASDVFAPVSGEVVEANAAVNDDPSLVNTDPLGKGWFIKLRIKDKG